MGDAPVFDIDLFADDILADSSSTYRALRDMGDAVWVPKIGMFVVARFADVVKALRASDTLISGMGVSVNPSMNGETQPANQSTLTSDGDQHRMLKRVEMRPLMPNTLASLRERVEDEAESIVLELTDGQEFEAMTRLASHLPLKIVADLVGIRNVGPEQMLHWSGAIFDSFGPSEKARTAAALPTIGEFVAYGMQLTRADVVPGSWSDRLFECADNGELTLELARNIIFDYVLPSLDTTIYATGELLFQLGTVPGAFDAVCENPGLIPGVINEAVRLSSPLRGFTRYVREDFQLSETVLPAGSRVWNLYASANRDERHFADPDRFDVARNPRDHLGWGHGVHLCSGMHLARLEMEAILAALCKHVGSISASVPTRIINNSAQGYATLPLRLVPKGGRRH